MILTRITLTLNYRELELLPYDLSKFAYYE